MTQLLQPTNDFSTWLQAVALEGLEAYALYQAVENFSTEGPFSYSPGPDIESTVHVVTTPAVDLKLYLVSETARQTFLTRLRQQYMNGMQPAVWLSLQREQDSD